MEKIRELPPEIINQIAAGEVIDSPVSVVKELVENAIDAGSTEITVKVIRAGLDTIEVSDNGCGIPYEEIPMFIKPHATSKLRSYDDLFSLKTFGFRGEAVSSIAAVSHMMLSTRVPNAPGHTCEWIGGVYQGDSFSGTLDGTRVTVSKLFFNTPVRLGFLKSEKVLEAEVTQCMLRFILAFPKIRFAFFADGDCIVHSLGTNEEEAMLYTYGPSVLKECIKVDAQRGDMHIYGYIGNQFFSKSNRSYQSIFLNGRCIESPVISGAIANAYSTYLMKKKFPFYVLNIDMPEDQYDVNVHPKKLDVKFLNSGKVYGVLFSLISGILDGETSAMQYVSPDSPYLKSKEETEAEKAKKDEREKEDMELQRKYGEHYAGVAYNQETPPPTKTEEELRRRLHEDDDLPFPKNEAKEEKPTLIAGKSDETYSERYFNQITSKQRDGFGFAVSGSESSARRNSANMSEASQAVLLGSQTHEASLNSSPEHPFGTSDRGLTLERAQKEEREREELEERITYEHEFPPKKTKNNIEGTTSIVADAAKDERGEAANLIDENKKIMKDAVRDGNLKQSRIDTSSFRFCGKLFNTYLIYESETDAYIIDQHAAHERLIFDKLKKRVEERTIAQQPLLVPYILEVNVIENVFVGDQLENIRALGFDIEPFGSNSYKVSAIPTDLGGIDLKQFFDDIIGDMNSYKGIKLNDILKDKLATSACKAAVKGGMDLTEQETQALLNMMDGNMGIKCPHGRPVVVKLTKYELEKMFKRIV